jgi:ribosomal protein S18 acetylase RimI-like enzyme
MVPGRNWQVRPTWQGDRTAISQLLLKAPWKHLHLDWTDPLDLLQERPSLMIVEFRQPLAALACPPEPKDVSWLRMFVVSDRTKPRIAWRELWPVAEQELEGMAAQQAALLALHDWMREPALASGFAQTHEVIFLKWRNRPLPPPASFPGNLRRMRPADLGQVHRVDHDAFEPIWRNSRRTLEGAFQGASYATVVEGEARVIGYQLSTVSPLGGHIARLAVSPDHQGQGLGHELVRDAIERLRDSGVPQVTVNTQSDNQRSLELYRRLDFHMTDQRFPVLQKALTG